MSDSPNKVLHDFQSRLLVENYFFSNMSCNSQNILTLNWKKTTLSGKKHRALKIWPGGFLGSGSNRFHSRTSCTWYGNEISCLNYSKLSGKEHFLNFCKRNWVRSLLVPFSQKRDVSLCQSIIYTFFPQKQTGVYHNKPTATRTRRDLEQSKQRRSCNGFLCTWFIHFSNFFAVRLQNSNTK